MGGGHHSEGADLLLSLILKEKRTILNDNILKLEPIQAYRRLHAQRTVLYLLIVVCRPHKSTGRSSDTYLRNDPLKYDLKLRNSLHYIFHP